VADNLSAVILSLLCVLMIAFTYSASTQEFWKRVYDERNLLGLVLHRGNQETHRREWVDLHFKVMRILKWIIIVPLVIALMSNVSQLFVLLLS
jgi:hypothetical protein